MTFKKKLKILDILPADPTRVNVDRIIEVSEHISKKGIDTFSFNEIYEGKIKHNSRTTIIAVLSYLSRLNLLDRTKRRRVYRINKNKEGAVNYFKNLENNDRESAFENLKNIFIKHELFQRLEGLFEEKKLRSKDELFQYFTQIEDKSISQITIDRKIAFLCILLDRIGLAYYNQEKRELLWKNGVKRQTGIDEYLEIKSNNKEGGDILKGIKFEDNKLILTFDSNKDRKEFLSKIIKET